MKEDRESWLNFKGRGLAGVRLIIGDKCLGMLESIPVVFPEAKYQRCTVHFYRSVFTVTPKTKMKQVTLMLKAIHAQESKEATQEAHWSRIRTNNLTERVNREIRRRTRAIGAFPDGNSALMLVGARLRHVAASEWGSKRYNEFAKES